MSTLPVNPASSRFLLPRMDENEPQGYLGSGWTNLPGLSNVLWTPMDYESTMTGWTVSRAAGDEEGAFDAGLRLVGMPLSMLHAVSSLITCCINAASFLHTSFEGVLESAVKILGPPTLIFGLCICVIEGIYEAICIARNAILLRDMQISMIQELDTLLNIADAPRFRTACSAWLRDHPQDSLPESLRKRHALLQDILNRRSDEELMCLAPPLIQQCKEGLTIQTLIYFEAEYFAVNTEEQERIDRTVSSNFGHLAAEAQQQKKSEMQRSLLTVKRTQLDRRIRPWCRQAISRDLKPLLDVLTDPTADARLRTTALTQAENLLSSVDIQAKKMLLIHAVGLAAIVLSAIGFTLSLIACPAFIPFTLLIVGGIMTTASYYYKLGALEEAGWNFSGKAACPWLYWAYEKLSGFFTTHPSAAPQEIELQMMITAR